MSEYEEMTVEELRELASEYEIAGRSSMNKDELVAALEALDEEPEEAPAEGEAEEPTGTEGDQSLASPEGVAAPEVLAELTPQEKLDEGIPLSEQEKSQLGSQPAVLRVVRRVGTTDTVIAEFEGIISGADEFSLEDNVVVVLNPDEQPTAMESIDESIEESTPVG